MSNKHKIEYMISTGYIDCKKLEKLQKEKENFLDGYKKAWYSLISIFGKNNEDKEKV